MKNFIIEKLNIMLLIVSVVVTIINVVVGSHIQQGFDISIGDVSPRTFTATHLVENRIATERLRDEARATVLTLIIVDPEIEIIVRQQLTILFEAINNIREIIATQQELAILSPYENGITINNGELNEEALQTDTNEFIEEDNPILLPQIQGIIQSFPLLSGLTIEQLEILLFSNQGLFNHFQNSILEIFTILMEQGVSEYTPSWEQEIYSLLAIRGISYPLNSIGFLILNEYIEPNNLPDEEATNIIREERAMEIEPIVFLQSQNIVNEGEIITEEVYYALLDLGYITEGYTINFIPIFGSIGVIITLFGIVTYYIYLFVPTLYKNQKHALLLFTLYMIIVFGANLLSNLPYIFMPVLIFTMLVGMLISYKLAIVLNMCVTIITFLIRDGDLSYILYFIITGTVVAIITRFILERNKLIIFSIFISMVSGIVAISINLLLDRTFTTDSLFIIGYGALSGFFSVIICIGTLPIWESFFGVITPIKLLDLTNPSNELLRRLSVEAPGTYHHSIIVANLAEAAAYDINADTVVTRVSAYFHDIGKLRHPKFFIENQVGINPHDEIHPVASAEIIIDHVHHGLELADTNKLPLIIRDIIQQHHGTTLLKYFYEKERELNKDQMVDEKLFKYLGPIPQFKEAAIVMLADTVEAAVRSVISKRKTKEDVAIFVRSLIKDKLMEGQLLDSNLTIKDIDVIEKSFIRVLNGMYHERIPYPKKKD